jgi:hypothetical protein
MSFVVIFQLTSDSNFGGRTRACATQQAETFKDDTRPDIVALANGLLRGELPLEITFIRITAAAPGMAEKANSSGSFDQSRVLDADILAAVQANFPVVAALYYQPDGTALSP